MDKKRAPENALAGGKDKAEEESKGLKPCIGATLKVAFFFAFAALQSPQGDVLSTPREEKQL